MSSYIRLVVPYADARAIGEARQAIHEGRGHRDGQRLYPDRAKEHTLGAAGELAFSQASGLEVDREQRLGGDKGIDFHVPGLCTIDVKTTKLLQQWIHPDLWLKPRQLANPADWYVHVVCFQRGRTGETEFICYLSGMIGAEMLQRLDLRPQRVIHDWERVVITPDKLVPVEPLLAAIGRHRMAFQGATR